MANPQMENGYTPIANELLEQVYKLKLNGTQFKIILVVCRYTYGFSRDQHKLSESFIAKAADTHKKQISRELNALIKLNIIKVAKDATFTESRIISLNKNYSVWVLNNIQGANQLPPNEIEDGTGSGLVTSTGSGLVTQENNIKTNIKQKDIKDIVDSANALPTVIKIADDSFEFLTVESIIHSCLELYPNSKVPCTYAEKEKWASEISKMKRLDNRTEAEIKQALEFAIKDEFWKTNIRSTKKFREKFETLYIQSKQKKIGKQNKGQQLQDEFVANAREWINERAGIS